MSKKTNELLGNSFLRIKLQPDAISEMVVDIILTRLLGPVQLHLTHPIVVVLELMPHLVSGNQAVVHPLALLKAAPKAGHHV